MYGITEKQFRKHLAEAVKQKGVAGDNLIARLETRLDNVIYRLGLASSRATARNLVNHGHISVNGRSLNIPSAYVKVGDEIDVKKTKQEKKYFLNRQALMKKSLSVPGWLSFDAKTMKGKVLAIPNRKDIDVSIDIQEVVEFYSR
jgi:small subunit ribosomal protein S4